MSHFPCPSKPCLFFQSKRNRYGNQVRDLRRQWLEAQSTIRLLTTKALVLRAATNYTKRCSLRAAKSYKESPLSLVVKKSPPHHHALPSHTLAYPSFNSCLSAKRPSALRSLEIVPPGARIHIPRSTLLDPNPTH